MTSRKTETGGGPDRGAHWPTTVASLAVGAVFFALWFWLLPSWLGFHVDTAGAARWRWIAAVPSVLGFAVALRCVWDFGWTGHGTPAPVAPPKRLVVGFSTSLKGRGVLRGTFIPGSGMNRDECTPQVACAARVAGCHLRRSVSVVSRRRSHSQGLSRSNTVSIIPGFRIKDVAYLSIGNRSSDPQFDHRAVGPIAVPGCRDAVRQNLEPGNRGTGNEYFHRRLRIAGSGD